ncbi:MAG TPA: FAD-dependent oxidoreductase [bacterium]|nr:FAD-dependent oxidoreductase [bacterium]
MPHFLIIGNSFAGTHAAKACRTAVSDGDITICSSERFPFYSKPKLPAFIAGEVAQESLCVYPESWYADNNLCLVLNERAVSVDPAAREVTFANGAKRAYDKLLIANGSQAAFPPIAGLDQPWVFSLRTLDDAIAIRAYAQGKRSAIVIGGGLLGLEAGNGLRKLGLSVQVVEFFDRLLPRQTDKDGSAVLQETLKRMGFSFILGAVTERIYEESGKRCVKLKDGRIFSADMVIVSAGIRPDTDLARTAGLKLAKGVVVDDRLQTSDPDIFAAGDVAEHQGRIYGIWPAAEEQGKIAGNNMSGEGESYKGTVMSTMLKVVGVDVSSAGDISGDGAVQYFRADEQDSLYQKIFVRDNAIIGAILIGDTKKAFMIQKMIRDRVNVNGREDKILLPDFNLRAMV